ncbi:MAG: rRNA maturation RNase YbeY [Pseudomonadota bacterium]
MHVETVIEDPRWEGLDLAHLAETAARASFDHLALSGLSLACLGTDDARIARLNAQFRTKPTPTNVLSWPSEELSPDTQGAAPSPPTDPEIGDIALAYETCCAEAQTAGIAVSAHVTHLVIHGILHLLGYDHQTDKDADLMENIEIAILMSLGIANPYG